MEGAVNGNEEAAEAATPELHVIVLGSGGGPFEANATALLVHHIPSGWARGSIVAVDSGVGLSAILKILEKDQPPDLGEADAPSLPHALTTGPFKGLELPSASAEENASHIHNNILDTWLFTHAHLDHIAGFVMNTANFSNARPKRIAGLPSTIDPFKKHIFNNIIWPNMTDQDNGAGLVTYLRLRDGGSPAVGEGEGRGYIEISEGLSTKVWSVSHGHCIERHQHRGSISVTRQNSIDASSIGGYLDSVAPSPGALSHHNLVQQQQQHREQDRALHASNSQTNLGLLPIVESPNFPGHLNANGQSVCVNDSSAYFIRCIKSGREILVFGDVEPDSVSLSPRNWLVWQQAAPKLAAGKLTGIFIESSYDDSQPTDLLYGHMTPKFIDEEMRALATEVVAVTARMLQQDNNASAAPSPSNAHFESQAKLVPAAPPGSDRMEMSRSEHESAGADKKRKRENSDGFLHNLPVTSRRTSVTSNPTTLPALADKTNTATMAAEEPVSPRSVRSGRGAATESTRPPGKTARINGYRSFADESHSPRQHPLGTSHLASPAEPLSLDAEDPTLGDHTSRIDALAEQQTQSQPEKSLQNVLKGLKVVIIHVKDKNVKGVPIRQIIRDQLLKHEERSQLGVEYIMSYNGQDLFF
ncbi:cAMP phosphodiesterases class-II-domain-containing protein [Diplogelasinospora grovesii]|uniref:cAMP phosphodiesterases class-II-domain-containing protein n=1 Tax=Diplogelasinospora grovesii TaxID=303347 RepID=A0AAN6S770_9PEZI|nr:cAMP phosphodiesterases class-II-domain-containing protein [Diplogelasinospora grovesii]